MAWESIMPAVIYTCFTNCGFGTANSVNTNSDEENCEWLELQGHTDCPQYFQRISEC
jgi:hypothetical protein